MKIEERKLEEKGFERVITRRGLVLRKHLLDDITTVHDIFLEYDGEKMYVVIDTGEKVILEEI